MVVGLGLDLVDVARIRKMLERKGDHALRRLFTDGERDYATKRHDPAMHLAARVAAKEAAFKALSGSELARGVGWKEIEVVPGWDGPTLAFHGLAQRRAEELGVTRVHVTMSHTATTAGAVVVLERDQE